MSADFQVQGESARELARQFGTPLFVYDGDALVARFDQLRALLHPALEIFYSVKANPNMSVCALLRSRGARAEISSLTELITARQAGMDPADIIFLGPGKSQEELIAAVDQGVHAIICESYGELGLIDAIARQRGTRAPVALRVNPAFAVKKSGLTMGGKPRQFGMDEEQLLADPGLARRFPAVRLIGVHAYLGTRILDAAVIAENTARILRLAEVLADRLAFPLELVDVGGGLGVAYFDGETDLDPAVAAAALNPVVTTFTARHPHTRLILELGRYLVAHAGTYMVRVRYVKTSQGQRFAVTDGGVNHHMPAVGIGSFVKRNFPIRHLSSRAGSDPESWNITGPLCTPEDLLGKNVMLPPVRAGDLLGVLRSGAYGPTASPVLFLSHGCPAEVLLHQGQPVLVRRRDTPDDLLRTQIPFDPAPAEPQATERP
jgi:diaminopimelate decarboxylase